MKKIFANMMISVVYEVKEGTDPIDTEESIRLLFHSRFEQFMNSKESNLPNLKRIDWVPSGTVFSVIENIPAIKAKA